MGCEVCLTGLDGCLIVTHSCSTVEDYVIIILKHYVMIFFPSHVREDVYIPDTLPPA